MYDFCYEEDQIVKLKKHLDNLKNKPLLDSENKISMLVNYTIKNKTIVKKGLFTKKKEMTMYYINDITLINERDIVHFTYDNEITMCSVHGIQLLMSMRNAYKELEENIRKFSQKRKINIKLVHENKVK